MVIIVVVQVVMNAKDTMEATTGESVRKNPSLLVPATTAVRKHTAALVADANRERRPTNTVLLKG